MWYNEVNKIQKEQMHMKTPFLGCAYYPEDWNESFMEDDIKK